MLHISKGENNNPHGVWSEMCATSCLGKRLVKYKFLRGDLTGNWNCLVTMYVTVQIVCTLEGGVVACFVSMTLSN